MSYRRRQQLHRVARRASQPGRQPNAAGRHRDAAPLSPASLAAARPVLPPASRTDAVGEPERDGASPRQGLDRTRRAELASIVLGVLLSPLIAAVGIWYSNAQVRDQLNITQEGQITDRYTKAVENLGANAMDVRLGGVYALQRIMEDSPRDHPTIANVLATYIRTHASKPPKKGTEVPADVHAALNVLAQRDTTRDKSFTPDLRDVHLPDIELPATMDTNLSGANLRSADLSDADLPSADLSGADLSGADLTSVDLSDADLSNAHLTLAHLTFANLRSADLTDGDLTLVDLFGADLRSSDLSDADLTDAYLTRVDLRGADLTDAHLSDAHLSDAHLSNAHLRGADLAWSDLSNADLRGADLSDANLTGADLSDANLTGARGLRLREMTSALIDSRTHLPPGLASNPAVKARIAEVEKESE